MEDAGIIRKKRALSSEDARWVRQSGHNDALEFAISIGQKEAYTNNPHAKKDCFDLSGDTYSVKSGKVKWQIFLYGRKRFETDMGFRVMNGIGDLIIQCIDCFPKDFSEYQISKINAKEKLRVCMRALLEKFRDKTRLKAFFNQSIFSGGEVNYLVAKHDGMFHVFLNQDVIEAFGNALDVANSQARRVGNVAEQKVVFLYQGKTLAELEMRNDGVKHYRQVRFNMLKPKAMNLLLEKISVTSQYNDKVLVHGNALKKFGHWKR